MFYNVTDGYSELRATDHSWWSDNFIFLSPNMYWLHAKMELILAAEAFIILDAWFQTT